MHARICSLNAGPPRPRLHPGQAGDGLLRPAAGDAPRRGGYSRHDGEGNRASCKMAHTRLDSCSFQVGDLFEEILDIKLWKSEECLHLQVRNPMSMFSSSLRQFLFALLSFPTRKRRSNFSTFPLQVSTPLDPSNNDLTGDLPVMFWVHGGGFTGGSGESGNDLVSCSS